MNKSTSPMQDWAKLSHSMLPKQKSFDDLMTDQNKWDYTRLRGIARNTPMIVNARIVLKETIFKNRFEWLPAFASKCTVCDFISQVKVDFCSKCGGDVREPDAEEITDAEEFFKSVNEYAESLIEVLESAEDEINITDSAWLLLLKKYSLLPTGEQDHKIIDDYKVLAIEKLYPEYIFHNIDKQTGRHKQEWFCIQHRNEAVAKEGYCKFCGVQLLPAYYFYKHEDNIIYYAKDELIWWHFYDTRGYSPIRAILKLVMTQWGLDDELFERYYHKVLPKSIIAVTTSNLTSLAKERDYIIKKAKENEVPFVGIESSSGRGTIQKISLMDDSVTDLSNEPTRDLIRREINTVYGVVPLYSADTERASALSGEGQQLMVQDDRAKAKQAKYNEFVLPQILKALKIEDWILQLKTPMGDSEIQILEVESKKIQNAQGMLNMGFDVILDDDNNFIFSGEAKQPDTMMESPFEMSFEKARKYIKDPSQAPKGAKVQQGKRGGYYYDMEGDPEKTPEKKPQISSVDDINYTGMSEDEIEDTKDMVEELLDVDAEIHPDGTIRAYHRTSSEAAKKIRSTGSMVGLEDGVFFSTKETGSQAEGFGTEVIVIDIPVHMIEIDDIFDDEAHIRIPTKRPGAKINISNNLIKILSFQKLDSLLLKARFAEVMQAIHEGALWEGYEGLTLAQSETVNKILEENFTRPYISLRKIVKDLTEAIPGLTEAHADLIGVTEMAAVVNKARELDFISRDPEGTELYKWLNPLDKYADGTWRTTDVCRKIVDRTKHGVTMKDLKRIVKEEASKDPKFRYSRDWVPHFGCRSSIGYA